MNQEITEPTKRTNFPNFAITSKLLLTTYYAVVTAHHVVCTTCLSQSFLQQFILL